MKQFTEIFLGRKCLDQFLPQAIIYLSDFFFKECWAQNQAFQKMVPGVYFALGQKLFCFLWVGGCTGILFYFSSETLFQDLKTENDGKIIKF